MKTMVFNDSRQIEIQTATEAEGVLHVRLILTTAEQLKALFGDKFATAKMTVFENGRVTGEYENYTEFKYVKEEVGGIYEVELRQKEADTGVRLNNLETLTNEQEKEIEKIREEMQQGGTTPELQAAAMIVTQFSAQDLPDALALEAKAIYPVWDGNSVKYTKDHKVLYKDVLFKCLTEHTSQAGWAPDAAPSLWAKVLIPDPEVIPEWEQPDSTNPYMKGDKVKHNGKTWESLVNNNVWEPGVVGTEGQWKEVV